MGDGNDHSGTGTPLPGDSNPTAPAQALCLLHTPNEAGKRLVSPLIPTGQSHTNDFRCIILHIRELHVFHISIICCRLWRNHLAASSCRRAGAVLLPHALERGLRARWRWSIHAGRRDRRLLGIRKGCFQLVQLFLQVAHSVSKCFIGLRKEGHWTGDLSCLSHFFKETTHSLREPIPNPWTLQW